jgi:hypothetical protein
MTDVVVLPRIPSELLRIALRDMKLTIKQGYNIRMYTWGRGTSDIPNECSVCFAGSVMLQTTQRGRGLAEFSSTASKSVNSRAYLFLDSIRSGKVREAMKLLEIPFDQSNNTSKYDWNNWIEKVPGWTDFQDDSDKFMEEIEDLIVYFKSLDL